MRRIGWICEALVEVRFFWSIEMNLIVTVKKLL